MLMPSIFRENLFDDFFDDFAAPVRNVFRSNSGTANVMQTDVKETDSSYELDVDLPGFQKEDVHAELKDGYLTIQASRNADKDEKDENGKYIRRERYYGSCSRSFYVGEDVTQDEIKAKFENGILKLTVPKKEAKEPEVEAKKYISIEG